MGQNCKCCNHPKRLEIDKKLVSGLSMAGISKEYGMSEASVMNHRDKHLTRQLATACQARDLKTSGGLLDILQGLLLTADMVISEAWKQQKLGTCLQGVEKAGRIVGTVAAIVVKLKELELQRDPPKTSPVRINVRLMDDEEMETDIPAAEETIDTLVLNDDMDSGIPIPIPKEEVLCKPAISSSKPLTNRFKRRVIEHKPDPDDNNSIRCKKPVKKVKPISRKSLQMKPVPHLQSEKIDMSDMADDQDLLFKQLAAKYIKKPKQKVDPTARYTTEELEEEIDGLSLGERLKPVARCQRAH